LNYAGKVDASHSADGSGLFFQDQAHNETITRQGAHAPADAIIVADAQLLFNGDFKRSGVDLIVSKDVPRYPRPTARTLQAISSTR